MIRGEGMNRALHPNQLLSLFMEVEEAQFLQRFRAATKRLSDEIAAMTRVVRVELDGVFESAREAQGRSEDSAFFAEEAMEAGNSLVELLQEMSMDMASMGRAIGEVKDMLEKPQR